jgi:serine acetyltransferase
MNMVKQAWSKNPYIRNGKLAELYLFWLRKGWRVPVRIVEMIVNCQIACQIPEWLFIPHPSGIVTGTCCQIANDVVLLQQVTLGGRYPYYCATRDPEKMDPILKEGVYV